MTVTCWLRFKIQAFSWDYNDLSLMQPVLSAYCMSTLLWPRSLGCSCELIPWLVFLIELLFALDIETGDRQSLSYVLHKYLVLPSIELVIITCLALNNCLHRDVWRGQATSGLIGFLVSEKVFYVFFLDLIISNTIGVFLFIRFPFLAISRFLDEHSGVLTSYVEWNAEKFTWNLFWSLL